MMDIDEVSYKSGRAVTFWEPVTYMTDFCYILGTYFLDEKLHFGPDCYILGTLVTFWAELHFGPLHALNTA